MSSIQIRVPSIGVLHSEQAEGNLIIIRPELRVKTDQRYFQNVVAVPTISGGGVSNMVAPISGNSLGLVRAQVSHGVRQVSDFTFLNKFFY